MEPIAVLAAERHSPPGPAQFGQRLPHLPGSDAELNGSVIEWKGGHLWAYRTGRHKERGGIVLQQLDAEFRVLGVPDRGRRLALDHPACNWAQEDPRFFLFRGKLHLAFTGVMKQQYGPAVPSVLYARLSDDFRVERVHAPHFLYRNPWEKNWSFFEHAGALYAVYNIFPHVVLKIDGDRAGLAHLCPVPVPWVLGTDLRGGAAPVRVGDEFWHFFHSHCEKNGRKTYVTGVYTFAATPPFRPQRVLHEPILWPVVATNGSCYDVVFACGAFLRGDEWTVSHGVHDEWTELHRFSKLALEARMTRLNA